jgi:hypothetical protein
MEDSNLSIDGDNTAKLELLFKIGRLRRLYPHFLIPELCMQSSFASIQQHYVMILEHAQLYDEQQHLLKDRLMLGHLLLESLKDLE